MIKKRFGIVLVFALSGCGGSETAVAPEDLISEDKMIPILVDLQLLESFFQQNFGHPSTFRHALDSSSDLIFQDYGVDREQFESSFDYYAADANRIMPIYTAALDSINFRLSSLSESSH